MSSRIPPSVGLSPILEAINLANDPIEYMHALHQEHPSGFTLTTGFLPDIHYLTKSEDIDGFTQQANHFDAGVTNASIGSFDLAFGDRTVVVLDGDEHDRTAAWISNAISLDAVLPSLSNARRGLRDDIGHWPIGSRFDLYHAIRRVAAGVIVKLVLGADEPDKSKIVEELMGLLNSVDDPLRWLVERRKFQKPLDKMINRYIFRKTEDPQDDVLSRLISSKRDWVTNDDLRHNLMTLLVLGHEGMSAAVTWGLYYLYNQPGVYDEVKEDIDWYAQIEVFANGDLKRIPNLNNLKKETLRMTPALISVHRRARCPVKIGKWEFDEGAAIGACMLFAHRNPEDWKDAESFALDRFSGEPPTPGSYFPFGIAPRSCPGEHLAAYEIPMLISEIAYRFGRNLRIVGGEAPELGLRGNILTPKNGIPAIIDGHQDEDSKSSE
ncbi:MAG: cytochrome P450 [Candidatus Azotimanducaceae bacterium]